MYMDAGGVEVQHQPSNQDPTRQSWRNNSSSGGDQGKRRDNNNNNKSKPVNLKSINVERAQNMSTASRTGVNTSGVQPLRTPKTAQFPKQNQQQLYTMPPKTATYAQQHINLSRSPPPQNIQNVFTPQTYNLSKSPPNNINNNCGSNSNFNNNNNVVAAAPKQTQQKSANSRPVPKPLNLSKSSSQVSNLGRIPQTATFPPKVNRALNLPNPPKTATFPSKSGFPKDARQPMRTPQSATIPQMPYAYVYGEPAYIQTSEQSRFRRYSNTPAPLRYITADYRQVQLGPGTPVVVLSHPEDSDSQGSSPPTPGYGPPEGFTGADVYDLYSTQYDDEAEEGQYIYYYYDYPQQDYYPQTPTGTSHQARSNTVSPTMKEGRRRSVFGGPMKVHPDAVLPIRQPKGPDMAKNFATRIRRKAVNKLFAAAAERRSKSAADRRKSAMF